MGVGLRALVVTAVLLLVFGALFAGADSAFASLLGDLMPDASVTGGPWRLVLLAFGLVGALAVAHTAAAPAKWDRVAVPAGRPRNRVEWALPLILLVLLFAAFNAVQLAVLFGGYDAVLEKTGQTYAEYARQGFWQLLLVTLLTLLVVVFALRWAPRDGAADRKLVRGVLGTLCALALVVVASAVRRMDMYVEAYGLTRLRVSVVGGELWLGLVIVLIMAAGVWGARWLPRAVAASAAAGVLAFGLMSPDSLIAERNVQRYEETQKFDLDYARSLSADAVPALDKLKEPMRSCALRMIADDLGREDQPWYATSWGEARRVTSFATARRPAPRTGACAAGSGTISCTADPCRVVPSCSGGPGRDSRRRSSGPWPGLRGTTLSPRRSRRPGEGLQVALAHPDHQRGDDQGEQAHRHGRHEGGRDALGQHVVTPGEGS